MPVSFRVLAWGDSDKDMVRIRADGDAGVCLVFEGYAVEFAEKSVAGKTVVFQYTVNRKVSAPLFSIRLVFASHEETRTTDKLEHLPDRYFPSAVAGAKEGKNSMLVPPGDGTLQDRLADLATKVAARCPPLSRAPAAPAGVDPLRRWPPGARTGEPRAFAGANKYNVFPAHQGDKVGTGLCAGRFVPRDALIIRYTGELIGRREEHRRERRRGYKGNAQSYTIAVPNEPLGHRIDASRCGSLARFANHSCAPNATLVEEGREIWLQARTDIAPGEFFGVDYGWAGEKGCTCGAAVCTGEFSAPDHHPAAFVAPSPAATAGARQAVRADDGVVRRFLAAAVGARSIAGVRLSEHYPVHVRKIDVLAAFRGYRRVARSVNMIGLVRKIKAVFEGNLAAFKTSRACLGAGKGEKAHTLRFGPLGTLRLYLLLLNKAQAQARGARTPIL